MLPQGTLLFPSSSLCTPSFVRRDAPASLHTSLLPCLAAIFIAPLALVLFQTVLWRDTMSKNFPLYLYRTLLKKCHHIEGIAGEGMQAVAWSLFGPLFHPAMFEGRSVQEYLRSQFATLPPGLTAQQRIQQALWVYKRVDHVTKHLHSPDCGRVPHRAIPEERIDMVHPLVDAYAAKTEVPYLSIGARCAHVHSKASRGPQIWASVGGCRIGLSTLGILWSGND